MTDKVYLVVVLKDQSHINIPVTDAATAREAVTSAAAAIAAKSSFKIGEWAAFSGAEVVSVYACNGEPPPALTSESLFGAVFGKKR